MNLIVKVKEIKGTWPIYSPGDSILIRDGYILDTKNSSPVCMHSLASIMPYYVALSKGVHHGPSAFQEQKRTGLTSSALTLVRLQVGELLSLK